MEGMIPPFSPLPFRAVSVSPGYDSIRTGQEVISFILDLVIFHNNKYCRDYRFETTDSLPATLQRGEILITKKVLINERPGCRATIFYTDERSLGTIE